MEYEKYIFIYDLDFIYYFQIFIYFLRIYKKNKI